MPASSFQIDIHEITRLADSLGRESGRVVRNELTTAMDRSTTHVVASANARVNHKTHDYSRSFTRKTLVTESGVIGVVTNRAASASGFVYAATLEWGRRGFSAIKARALRFEIGGVVFFRKSVGPAPAQHILEYGANDALPSIDGEFAAARDRIATRLMA